MNSASKLCFTDGGADGRCTACNLQLCVRPESNATPVRVCRSCVDQFASPSSSVIRQCLMVIVTVVGLGIGMNESRGKPGYIVNKAMLGIDGDRMGLDDGQMRRNHDVALGSKLVADPPKPYRSHVEHSRSLA